MTDTITYKAFRDALNALYPGWVVTPNGLVGPGGAAVKLAQRHLSDLEGHVDVQFVLDDAAPHRIGLWDCVTGYGATPANRSQSAAGLWAQTTACTWLELKYSQRGQFADHYRGNEAGGFSGWHSIAGAIMGFGMGDSADKLQQWWLDNPVLPTLARALNDCMTEQDCPYGLKILFGGDCVVEVRVNGEHHEAASAALASLPWPRLDPPGFVRSYVLVLHRDSPS
jgi:hypothetical protein